MAQSLSIHDTNFLLNFDNDINNCLVKFHKCFALLDKYRKYLHEMSMNCVCIDNNRIKFNELENEWTILFNSNQKRITHDLADNTIKQIKLECSDDSDDESIDNDICIEIARNDHNHSETNVSGIKQEKRDISCDRFNVSMNSLIEIDDDFSNDAKAINDKTDYNKTINHWNGLNEQVLPVFIKKESVNKINNDYNHNSTTNLNANEVNNKSEKKSRDYGKQLQTKLVFRNHVIDIDTTERFTDKAYVRTIISRKSQSLNQPIGYSCKWGNSCDFMDENINVVLNHLKSKHNYDSSRNSKSLRQPFMSRRIAQNDIEYEKMKRLPNKRNKSNAGPKNYVKNKMRYKNVNQNKPILFNGYSIGIDTEEIILNENNYISLVRSNTCDSYGKTVGYRCNWPHCDFIRRKKSLVLTHYNVNHKRSFKCNANQSYDNRKHIKHHTFKQTKENQISFREKKMSMRV